MGKSTKKRKNNSSQGKSTMILWLSVLVIALGTLIAINFLGNKSAGNVELPDLHGLGISADGETIYAPAHSGLKTFSGGQWTTPDAPENDYMGFSKVDDGFYSSGHPGPDSDLVNPFGVVKAEENGQDLQTLGLSGESDFHLFAAGYASHALYAFNAAPNSQMSEEGLYYSTDDAGTWTKSAMSGLEEAPTSLAVHPSDPAVVAVGTQTGLLYSEDNGDSFTTILDGVGITGVTFTSDGMLLVGTYQNNAELVKVDPANPDSMKTLPIPELTEDAVSYIAESPANPEKIVFGTMKVNMYMTSDGGNEWEQIVNEGQGMTIETVEQ
ncbi:F510_1955 family glycosylhydrolase [Bacillus fonticola]|uniref:F510_1955 family glycosylhydrolase n=1 Tax=Bacillus fonticola TaxID=2728853 RepID=UPI00147297F9|nr:glycosyl hydrolase [Bacillus fonticola]